MLKGIEQLNRVVSKNSWAPTDLDFIYYLFWKKGISYNEFNELPIPYIMSILQTHKHVVEKEQAEIDKQKKKAKR